MSIQVAVERLFECLFGGSTESPSQTPSRLTVLLQASAAGRQRHEGWKRNASTPGFLRDGFPRRASVFESARGSLPVTGFQATLDRPSHACRSLRGGQLDRATPLQADLRLSLHPPAATVAVTAGAGARPNADASRAASGCLCR